MGNQIEKIASFRNACDIEKHYDYKFFEGVKKQRGNEIVETRPMCVAYGDNGSGKSTLAKELLRQKIDGDRVLFLDKDGAELQIESGDWIHIFDEDFIESQVKARDDGLNTVVLIGDQVELQNEIDKLNKSLLNLEELVEANETQIAELENGERKGLEAIKNTLRGQGWKGRQSEITGKRANVTDKVVDDLLGMEKPKDDTTVLSNEFRRLLDVYKSAKGQARIDASVPEVEINHDRNAIRLLMDKVLVKSDGTYASELERRIDSLDFGYDQYQNIINDICDDSVSYCNKCLQNVTPGHKEELRRIIENIFKQTDGQHVEKLRACKLEFNFDLPLKIESLIDPNLSEKYQYARTELKDSIDTINRNIERRANNPYSPAFEYVDDVDEKTVAFRDVLAEIREVVERYNSACDEQDRISEKLTRINLQLAILEAGQEVSGVQELRKELAKTKAQLRESKDRRQEISERLNDLKFQQANVSIAVNEMNRYLEHIFLDGERLILRPAEGKYLVESRGAIVAPNDLSTGERNIIALVHFFVSLGSGHQLGDRYSHPALLVFDDPISSFDFGNRYGVFSMLAVEFAKILDASRGSKILVLTHDAEFAADMETQAKGLLGERVVYGEMKEGVFERRSWRGFDRYATILEAMYEFAFNDGVAVTGNDIRKVLEGFARFEYDTNVSDVFRHHYAAEAIRNSALKVFDEKPSNVEALASYFEMSLSRLYLHDDSHAEASILRGNHRLYPKFGIDEQRKIVRDVICFIWIANRSHLKARKHVKKSQSESFDSSMEEYCRKLID